MATLQIVTELRLAGVLGPETPKSPLGGIFCPAPKSSMNCGWVAVSASGKIPAV